MKVYFRPTEKQKFALKVLADTSTKYILYGGSSRSGKSYLGNYWVVKNCIQYPGVRYLIGRKQLSDLKATTQKTLFEKLLPSLGITAGDWYAYNAQDKELTFYNGSQILFRQLFYKPSDPLVQELGSLELTGAWIDEAGEVTFNVFDVLKARVGHWMNREYELIGKILLTSNPVKNWTYTEFYKPAKEGRLHPSKAFIPALPTDNEYLTEAEIDNLRNITDKVTRERLLLGNWEYEDDPSSLIVYENITNCFTNTFVPEGKPYITCDAARFGSDKAVIIRWSGLRAEQIISFDRSATTDIENKINELRSANQVPLSDIIVDEDGVGGGVVDHLHCKGFVNNSSPIGNIKENYANLKSQCYYKLAELINENKIFINAPNEQVKNLITDELELVKQKDVDIDGKLSIIPKDRVREALGRSPDYADALMMRVYFENIPPQRSTFIFVPTRQNRI